MKPAQPESEAPKLCQTRMMNLLSLALVISSLAGAAVWAPPPREHQQRQHHVREGQRIIVVENERQVDDKDDSSIRSPSSGKLLHDAKEAASLLPNLGQGVSAPEIGDAARNLAARVSETKEDAKEMAKAAAHRCAECAKGNAERLSSVPNKAREKMDTAKEAVKSVPEKAKQIAENVKEMAKEKADTAKETLKSAGNEAMENPSCVGEKAKEKAEAAKEMAKEKADTAKEAVNSAASGAMERTENVREMAVKKAETMKGMAKEKAETAKGTVKNAAIETMESLSGVPEKAKEKAETAKEAVKSAGNEAAESLSYVGEKVKKKAETVKEGVKSDAKQAAESLSSIQEKAKERAENVKETGGNLVKEGRPMDAVVGATKEGGEDFSTNILSIKDKIVERKPYELFMEVSKDVMEIIRRMQNVVYNIVAFVATPEAAKTTAAVVHVLGYVVSYGACIWVTFVSSHVLSQALPRHQFGMLQSKVYPVYFRVVAYAIGAMFLSYFFWWDLRSMTLRVHGYNMLAMLGLVLVNMLILEPKATKVMYERMKIEKEEGRGREKDMVIAPDITANPASSSAQPLPHKQEAVKSRVAKLNRKMKRLNVYSSFVNIATIMGLSLHTVHLARCLQQSC